MADGNAARCGRVRGVASRLMAAFCLGAALGSGPTAAAEAAFTVETAEFIVSIVDGEGGQRSIASTLVPYLPNRACFGWRIRLAEAPAVVRVREVLKLPEPPAFWSGEDDPYSPHTFSADRTTAITVQYQAPQDGWLENQWCIVAGDPTGPHSIKVFVDDALVRQFEFEVRKPAGFPAN